ncbi:SGNH/GDSL hydrolase family protein [Aquiflexum lacus]|uniref:SGNH/GDSL hydrolase family protein n=1 Tax=Aquiflexum lacus TaxID=2483805 RepID=UPI001895F466|nr:SGNH/GDSL hydrolase family protein [Aquiflexum lacus]
MINRLRYFFELILLLPFFPFFYFKGKKLRETIIKLKPQSEFLELGFDKDAKNILIIGESTAAGVGASTKENTFASQVYHQSQQTYNIHNLGKNGLKAKKLKRLLTHAKQEIPQKFEFAIILIGANDCFKFTPPGRFRYQLKDFIELLQIEKSVQRIIIPSIAPVQHFPSIPGPMRFFLGLHRSILTRELKSLGKKIPALDFNNFKIEMTSDLLASDGIHPSDTGYAMLAKATLLSFQKYK